MARTKSDRPQPQDYPYIAEQLRHLAVPISQLTADPYNARLHPDENLDAIRRSLDRFGQDQPLVVQRQGMIVRKGNGRLEAARSLGWTHVAVVVVDEDDIDAAARAIADNRSAELAQWDERVLLQTMQTWRESGPDARALDLGFTEDQLAAISARLSQQSSPDETVAVPPSVAPTDFPTYDENVPTEHRCPKCGYQWSGSST